MSIDETRTLKAAAVWSGFYVAGAMLTGAWYEHHCPTYTLKSICSDDGPRCWSPPYLVAAAWPAYWTYRAASSATRSASI